MCGTAAGWRRSQGESYRNRDRYQGIEEILAVIMSEPAAITFWESLSGAIDPISPVTLSGSAEITLWIRFLELFGLSAAMMPESTDMSRRCSSGEICARMQV